MAPKGKQAKGVGGKLVQPTVVKRVLRRAVSDEEVKKATESAQKKI